MGRLPFPPDAELTGPDRLVLSVMQKQYEAHELTADVDAAEESDDSAKKRSEFVAPSPEGNSMPFLFHEMGELNSQHILTSFQIYKTRSNRQLNI
jgi:hypothetical protein